MALVTSRNAAPKDMGLKTNRLRCMVCGTTSAKFLTVRPTDQKPACDACAGKHGGLIEVVEDAKTP